MGIDQELLERYHMGICTAAERRRVEDWLNNMDLDDLGLDLPEFEKSELKEKMWLEMERDFLNEDKPASIHSPGYFMWKGAIAASLVIAILSASLYFILGLNQEDHKLLSLNNSSAVAPKFVDSKSYNVTIGPNTSAWIDNAEGIIDLTGSLLISPKKDVDWIFEGTQKRVTLKKGQTYIVLKNSTDAQGIIVISERNLLDLPPVMQKQIASHFDI